MIRLALIAIAVWSAGCLRSTEFHCSSDVDCGAGGTCEASVGFCSFPDGSCGRRFNDSAGPYSNQCVAGAGGGGGSDAGVDAPVDAPASCAGFTPITGLPHLYQLVSAPNDWMSQSDHCTAANAAAYLAIPDDLPELQALDTLAGAGTYWVGIDDMAMEGTFVTVKGAAAAFLPWAAGEPDNGMNSDCAAALPATAELEDDKCNTQFPAICECEP